ncbi:hypothetical protein [Aeoliella sp.]|uniref:hypothetical protein n=1 Tax=Aeoliella sp. TaxID=2795800 RepID=UPI003CCBCD3A
MNRFFSLTNLACGLVVLTIPLLGCGDGRPTRVPISGQVLIDGKPLPQAFVKFVPEEGRAAGGNTDSDGRFTLTCYEAGDGASIGLHKVSVRATDAVSNVAIRWRAPKKYQDIETSEIEVEVSEPRDDLLIELTWDGGKPFVEKDPRAL